MAVASIIDINGVQWNVKDKEARDRITVVEDIITVKDLPNPKVIKNPDYSCSSFQIYNHYSFGKIHFLYLRWQNIKGSGIGTTDSARICSLDIKPKKETTFLMFDYVKGKTMRCYFEPDGNLYIGESNGVSSGNNVCFGELIFAEA